MRCLVTGGAGFIGFHLCQRLIESHDVMILDNFNSYYDVSLKEFNARELKNLGVVIVRENILNFNKIQDIMNKIDIVIHLAAQPGVRYSVDHPLEVYKINVDGTLNLLEAARRNNISLFVFASSSSIYGNCRELPIKEDHPTQPISPYGFSKLIGEKAIKFYNLYSNLPTVIFRFFSVIGARQRPDMGLYKFIFNILNNKPLTIFGDGNQTRDWSNVKNVVEVISKSIENPNVLNKTLNIGHGLKTSVNEIINILENKIGRKAKIINVSKNIAEPLNTQADINKIKNLLDYSPKYSLEEAIESEIDFIKSWKNILESKEPRT
ncbi:MAG: GDP-mannose 4,6-dehydratase [Candidatus Helarchaeota archaeon]